MSPGLSVPSASSRTVVYKGLFAASNMADFYWDLRDADYETAFAIFHQRYSTNTFPSWEIAQPFRALAHNGEINTVASNRSWTHGREKVATSSAWGDRLPTSSRSCSPASPTRGASTTSSSCCCYPAGRWPMSRNSWFPRPGRTSSTCSRSGGAFSDYHAFLTEPWDGPAGLRPPTDRRCWPAWTATGSALPGGRSRPMCVLVASEAGVCPEEEARATDRPTRSR